MVRTISPFILLCVFPGLVAAQPQPLHQATPWQPVPAPQPPKEPTPKAISLNPTTWTAIGPGPLSSGISFSGRIAAVAADPANANIIYIAPAGGGVWKTTNGGTNWTPLTDTQASLSMGCLAVAPSNSMVIYAGTGEANNSADSNYGRGFLVSTNGGTSWTQRTGPSGVFNTNRMVCSKIAVDPGNANVAYAAMSNFGTNGVFAAGITGIYKTTDGGVTWTNVTAANGKESNFPWSDVAVDPNTTSIVYGAVGYIFGTTTNGVYKSTDSGTTWNVLNAANAPVGMSFGRISIAISKASNANVLYVAAEDNTTSGGALARFVRSDDAGGSFNLLSPPNYMGGQGWYDQTLIVDPTNSAIVYAAGASGTNSILRSINSGASWTDIHTGGSSPHVDHHGITFDANGRLLDGDDGGIFRLDDPTIPTWSDLNGDLNTIQFTGIGLHPTDPNAAVAGSQDNGTEVFSGNLVWTETDGGDGGSAKYSPTNGVRVYHQIPNGSFGTNFFRRSDNGGTSWTTKTTSISVDVNVQNFYAPFAVDPGNGDRVLYGTNGVWETTAGGDSWIKIGTSGVNGFANTGTCRNLAGGTCVDAVAIAPSDVNTIYAATGGTFAGSSQIFVTTNHGAAWTPVPLPAMNHRVNEIQVDASNAMTAYAVVNQFGGGHVWKTINGGGTWTNISGNLPDLPVWSLRLDPANSRIFIGADDGVYATTNGGTTWSKFGTSLPNVQVFELALNTKTHILAAATHGRGAWEITVDAPPTADSLSPTSGSGANQTFTAMYSDPDGFMDLNVVYLLFNSSLNGANACFPAYSRFDNKLYLINDAGNGLVAGSLTPGMAGTLSNSQCTLNGTGSTVSGSVNTLTVNYSITFLSTFPGLKNSYILAVDLGNMNSGWQQKGTWTGITNSAPSVGTSTPSSGTGITQAFAVGYSDPNGFQDLRFTFFLVNYGLTGSNACYVIADRPNNLMYLVNDAGSGTAGPQLRRPINLLGPITPGSGSVSNSQCTLNGTGSSISGGGNNLTVTMNLTFLAAFGGLKNLWGLAMDIGGLDSSPWKNLGTWSRAANSAPTLTSVTPSSGSGTTSPFTMIYADTDGYLDLSLVYVLFNSTLNGANACFVAYNRPANQVYLINNAGTGLVAGSLTPGSAGSLMNSQCTVSTPSTVTGSGNNLTLPISLTFASPAFSGAKNIFMYAVDNSNANSGFLMRGTWTVP